MTNNLLNRKNNSIFRSVDFWKSAVMLMPDNSFFELLRSVFGKIKTPFKKQQLINDLETFLLREDIQQTIIAYIDENDAKVIAAVALFGEPAPGTLESFFTGELNYAQLQDIIVNLEERFILYRFNEDKTDRIALNPVLEQALLPFAKNVSPLFPAITPDDTLTGTEAPAAVLDDRILAGLLSFVSAIELFFRGENVIRKKVIEAGKTCFPGMDLPLVLGSLQALGLFYADGDRLVPDRKRFDDLGLLSPRERSEYCAAALLVYTEVKSTPSILPPLFRSRIREVTNFIHSFLNTFKEGLLYPEKSLIRMLEIFKTKTSITISGNVLLEVLEKTGLVTMVSPESDRFRQLGSIAKSVTAKHEGSDLVQNTSSDVSSDIRQDVRPVIAIDSGFSFIVYPEISYADAISLASIMNIREAGATVRFELVKDSVIRSFDRNVSADEITDLLNRLSGSRIDDNLIWTLKDWEKRHGEVSLKKGIVLTIAEEQRYLINTKGISNLIMETLAPGLYLLSENAMDDAANALHSAGIDIIARPVKTVSGTLTSNQFLPPSSYDFSDKINTTQIVPQQAGSEAGNNSAFSAAALIENFHAVLETMPLDKAARTELAARVDRRLILCETQLKEAVIRYEKLEARLLDYAGKQNIAKQALSQQSPLEIVLLGGEKTEKRIFGIPKALEKEGAELVLVIMPGTSGDSLKEGNEDSLRIPLAKISLLRRIKKSIFTT